MSTETADLVFRVKAENVEKTVNLLSTLESLVDRLTVVTNGLETAFRGLNNASRGASEGVNTLNQSETRNAQVAEKAAGSNKNLSAAIDGVYRSGERADKSMGNLNKRYKDITNNFNTSNIAAQIFDVGVTSAMGMNPFIIGIQQGTQLAQVFMNLEKPLENLKEGFKKILSPMTGMTIALVTLVAAGIEFVDWTSVAKSTLNGLATVLDGIGSFFQVLIDNIDVLIVALGSLALGFAIFKSGTILTGLIAVKDGFKSLISTIRSGITAVLDFGLEAGKSLKKWVKGLDPATIKIGLLVAAFVGVYVAYKLFKEDIEKFFTENGIGKSIKAVATWIVNSFVTAFDIIRTAIEWISQKITAITLRDPKAGPEKGFAESIMNVIDENYERTERGDFAIDISGGVDKTVATLNTLGKEAGKEVKDMFSNMSQGVRDFSDNLGKDLDKTVEKLEDFTKTFERKIEDVNLTIRTFKDEDYWKNYEKNMLEWKRKIKDTLPKGSDLDEFLETEWKNINSNSISWLEHIQDLSAELANQNDVLKDLEEEKRLNDEADRKRAQATEQLNDIIKKGWEDIYDLKVKTKALTMDTYGKTEFETFNQLQKSLENLKISLDDVDENGVKYRDILQAISKGQAESAVKYEETSKAIEEQKKAQRDLNKELERQKKLAEQAAEAWDKLVKQYDLYTSGATDLPIFADDMTRNRAEIQKQYLRALGFDTLEDFKASDFYTDDQKEYFDKMVEGAAEYKTETEQLNSVLSFAKDTTQDFFSTMQQDLRQGMSLWKAFGDAVVNVLNKILDKMLSVGVDQLFSGLQMAGYLPGGSKSIIESGGVTATGGTTTFAAKGHAFTNGIVDSPTLFKFAKGGRFGVMGEAGPEAVMPLTRGPDGNLGVRSVGGNADSAPVTVNVINNANAQASVQQRQTSQGIELDVMIDQVVAAKMAQPGTASNTSLKTVANRHLIMR